ncbi:hypothetical protein HanLR1_Chr04g0120141 [Helianthus annuus]|nr:hypothetical protein HanHA89_Chr04g0128001 [Helianthus annuus]KAJ0755822.1 hypothetical protein HanLR1_Chr04g0120141 [Helianthus annuus]
MISVQIIEYRGVISRIFKCFGNGVDGYCDRVSSFRMTEICFLDSFDYCQKVGLGAQWVNVMLLSLAFLV